MKAIKAFRRSERLEIVIKDKRLDDFSNNDKKHFWGRILTKQTKKQNPTNTTPITVRSEESGEDVMLAGFSLQERVDIVRDPVVPMNLDFTDEDDIMPMPATTKNAAVIDHEWKETDKQAMSTTLPKHLISIGMYTSAVSLLMDERFIPKRIQQLDGNVERASIYHIQDVLQLVQATTRRRSPRNEPQIIGSNAANSLILQHQSFVNEMKDLRRIVVDIYHSFLQVALQITMDSEEDYAGIARVFYRMGYSLSQDFGWAEEAMQLYNMYVLNEIIMDRATSNVKIFRAMGDIQFELRNWEEALSMYSHAQSIIIKEEQQQSELLSSSIKLRIGNVYCKQGYLSKALVFYNKAHKLQLSYLKQTQDNKIHVLRQLSYSLHNIGVVRRHMDDLDGALNAFSASVVALETVHPISPEDELRKANTFNNMAGVLRRMDRLGDALLLYKETLRIKKDHLTESHPSISLTLAAIASTLRASGQNQQAMKYYKAALK